MRTLAMHLAKFLIVLILGGLLGATLVRFAPGYGVDDQELDSRLSHESMQALRASSGADKSLAHYYETYLFSLMHGNLGDSRTLQQPVRQLLAERFPETIKLIACGLALSWTLGLALAILPILLRSAVADLFGNFLAGLLICLPAAVLALLVVLAHAPARIVVGLIIFPKIYRYAQNMFSHIIEQPHVIAAWAKGLGPFHIFLRHILPLAAPQLLALAGVSVSLALAAAIPVEVVCDLPGIGQLAWKAALGRDLELLVNLTMVVTIVTLIANSAADLFSSGLRVREA